MLTLDHPGPWQSYILRQDNIGLPLMEVRSKYLQEQLNYDNQVLQHIYMLSLQPQGGGSNILDNTINSFVEDDYVEDYFL
jgi:hypothetical protein